MSILSKNTVLCRLPDLDLHLEADGRVVIDLGARQITCGHHGLAVLAEFSKRRVVSEAVAALQSKVKGVVDWKDLMTTIVNLHAAGVLRDASDELPPPAKPPVGYGAAPVHINMLNDRARTTSFLEAIRKTVRPGDVVVDLGTGTGVLAMAAARAGAKRVYAIEQSSIGTAAQRLFEANGYRDRITLVEGMSTEIDLPERGDVLVSEMIGDDPLGEKILDVTADAVKRLIKPDARLIPDKIEVYGLPITIPRAKLEEHVFAKATLSQWRSWYEINFDPLAEVAPSRPQGFLINGYKARSWPTLSASALLMEADLKTIGGSVFHQTTSAVATASGLLNGVLVYFETDLAPGLRLSGHPAAVGPDHHWHSPVWILPDEMSLTAGQRIAFTYRHNDPEGPDGVSVTLLPSTTADGIE